MLNKSTDRHNVLSQIVRTAPSRRLSRGAVQVASCSIRARQSGRTTARCVQPVRERTSLRSSE